MTIDENIKFREEVIKQQFKEALGYDLNLENPKTFNEKLQWLKLYYHDPLMTKCADKYLAREYIKETIGEEYLIPLIGVWDNVDDIDFDSLPNQFVLKVNWGSGQNIIVKDKSKLNIEETKNKLNNWMLPISNHYYYSYEWQYKNVKPKIIAEKYIEQMNGNLLDYRIFCFNGNPHYVIVDINAYLLGGNQKYYRNIFNYQWEKLNFKLHYNNYDNNIEKPSKLNLMWQIANKLSCKFAHCRVDFYIIEDNLFIGELTFNHQNGIGQFKPLEWDYKFGELLQLPKEKKLEYDSIDKDTLLKQVTNLEPMGHQYKILEYNFKCANIIIENLNNDINIKNRINEELKLDINWFSLLSIFGIHLFAISNNSQYLRVTILGIKLTFKINKNSINKLAWWIPIKNLRNNFKDKFRPDQTRPDQTRPDQTRPNMY